MASSGSQYEIKEDKIKKEHFYVGAQIKDKTWKDFAETNFVSLISLPNGLNGSTKEIEQIAPEEKIFTTVLELYSTYKKDLLKHKKKTFKSTFVLGASGTQKFLNLEPALLKEIFKKYNGSEHGDLIQYLNKEMAPYAKAQEDAMKKLYNDEVEFVKKEFSAEDILTIDYRIMTWQEACDEFKEYYPKEVAEVRQKYEDDPLFRAEVNENSKTYLNRNAEDKNQGINTLAKILSEGNCPEVIAYIKKTRSFIEFDEKEYPGIDLTMKMALSLVRECIINHINNENAYFKCFRHIEPAIKTKLAYPKQSIEEGFKTIFEEEKDYIEAVWLNLKIALTDMEKDRHFVYGFPIEITAERLEAAKKARQKYNRAAHGFFKPEENGKQIEPRKGDDKKFDRKPSNPMSIQREGRLQQTPDTKNTLKDVAWALTLPGSPPEERENLKNHLKATVMKWNEEQRIRLAKAGASNNLDPIKQRPNP